MSKLELTFLHPLLQDCKKQFWVVKALRNGGNGACQ